MSEQWKELSNTDVIGQAVDTVTETVTKTTSNTVSVWNRVSQWTSSYHQFLLGAAVGSVAVWCIRLRK